MNELARDERDDHDSVEEVEPTNKDVTETDDGGAIVTVGDEDQQKQVVESAEFYDNLVEQLDPSMLTSLSTTLMDQITRDRESRKKRDEEYAESIKRTGLGKEAPGGADFDGASRTVHPVLMESSVDFAAQAIKEILPANGPVKIFIPGKDVDLSRLEKAERKKDYMNWQFTTQMPEFRSELDQLLPQLALGGSQYMRLVPDLTRRGVRPIPQFLPSDLVSIPYAASSFYSASRQTYHEPVTRDEFEERVESGMYFYDSQIVNPQLPERTKSEKASDKVEGKSETDFYNQDGLRTVHECNTFLDLRQYKLSVTPEDDLGEGTAEGEGEDPDSGLLPYIVSIDDSTRKIVRVVRNWEYDDENEERMQWIVEFSFVPWRGAYSVGLGQMIGSLAGSATGALRALLDAGHVNNLPTLLKLKAANFSGQSKEFTATGVTEVDGGATGASDIRQLVMPVPFNEPSLVLFQLLGFCVDAAKGVVRTTFEDLSEDNKNLPVGTTLALIEQGMKVTSAIHLRLHHAMTNVIRILHRIDKMYLTDRDIQDDTGTKLAFAKDFDGPVDCVPTADPEIFSDVQRMAQWQIVMSRVDSVPDLYNRREAEKRFLQRTRIPDAEGLLIPENKPTEMNPVNENAAMSLGRPVAAFPEQDHLAHLQVHLDFLMNPMLGGLPVIAPQLAPAMMQHIKEHVVLWYVKEFYEMSKRVMEVDDDGMTLVMKQNGPKVRVELERLLAEESPDVMEMARKIFSQLPQITQQGLQIAQQLNPPPQLPVDPNKMAETQRRERETQAKIAADAQSDQISAATRLREVESEERREQIRSAQQAVNSAKERLQRLVELDEKERAEDERAGAEIDSRERINTQDNLTALRISEAELAVGRKSPRSTGTGTDKNPQPR